MTEGRVMSHIPHAELVDCALDGSRASWRDAVVRHLNVCRSCRERLALYERAAAAGRLGRPGTGLLTPPDRLWTAVRTHTIAERSPTPPPSAPVPPLERTRILQRSAALARAALRNLGRLLLRLPLRARLRPRRSRRPPGRSP
ncbi:hypothetical protein J2X68_005197 [Streptomyces sp. 3330]|uniref:hypothetical protein n=1 Tax=Streptomyces sp. 3330 TaxID=2817755 RepID=UPI00285E0B1F|nr:hypothetical protein [Streptomyces sp. 3330]MDR6978471.1 hypothetical protein [Streptomyces sp. 3330]